MDMLTRVFATIASLSLTACASNPLSITGAETVTKIATDLDWPSNSLQGLSRCMMAQAVRGEKLAVFQPCLYVRASDLAMLVTFDEQRGTYRLLSEISPASANAAAFKEMGRAKQIQVHGTDAFVVFSLLSENPFGANAGTREAFDHLQSLGIKETQPLQYVYDYKPIEVRVQTQ